MALRLPQCSIVKININNLSVVGSKLITKLTWRIIQTNAFISISVKYSVVPFKSKEGKEKKTHHLSNVPARILKPNSSFLERFLSADL